MKPEDQIKDSVREKYGEIAEKGREAKKPDFMSVLKLI